MEAKNEKLYLINDVVPLYALHPGGTLREELRERKIKQKDFARSIGMQPSHLSALINGTRNITPAIAAKLEKGLGISASFWVNLQNNYNIDVKRIKERDETADKKSPEGQAPVKPYPFPAMEPYSIGLLAEPSGPAYRRRAKVMLSVEASDVELLEFLAGRMGWGFKKV